MKEQKSIFDRIERYDSDEVTEEYLGGHTRKMFARLDDDKESLIKRRKNSTRAPYH